MNCQRGSMLNSKVMNGHMCGEASAKTHPSLRREQRSGLQNYCSTQADVIARWHKATEAIQTKRNILLLDCFGLKGLAMTRGAMLLPLFFLLILVPFLASAQNSPVIFERQDIVIYPAAKPVTTNDAGEEITPASDHPPLRFSVEIRSEEAMKLEYIHTMNTLTETTGVMIVFTLPTMVSLPNFSVTTPVDVLFVDDQGFILQMLPGVVPANITQDIMAKSPVRAFIYLKAGTIKATNLRPRDRVESPVFTPPPPVIE